MHYALTPRGRSLDDALATLRDRAETNMHTVDRSRATFDAASRSDPAP